VTTSTSQAATTRRQPHVWLLLGHKAGDNTQVLALARALDWPSESKHMVYRSWELLTNRLLGITLQGINRRRSSTLSPPWPDLVITSGRRNEPVARWIRKQSGNSTKLVHIGRPWTPLETFDLIVTTPQYQLPDQRNILHNDLPLHGITREQLADSRRAWAGRFEHLPRPWIAVLVGGNSGPFVFTPNKGRHLGHLANRMAADRNGSLLVTSSARTPTEMFRTFLQEIDVPAYIHQWKLGATDNPYLGYLSLADEFIVTGESMSMLAEACATGRPLYIFDPSDTDKKPWWQHPHNFRYKPLTHRVGMWLGPTQMARDVSRIHANLIHSGRAVWLDEEFPANNQPTTSLDLDRAVEAVKALFATEVN
jgi:mitochondrial fission protein ELM1